jgi:hypothetical protein
MICQGEDIPHKREGMGWRVSWGAHDDVPGVSTEPKRHRRCRGNGHAATPTSPLLLECQCREERLASMILVRLGDSKYDSKPVTAEVLESAGIRLRSRAHQRLESPYQFLLRLQINAWEQGQRGRHAATQYRNQLVFALWEGQGGRWRVAIYGASDHRRRIG